MNAFLRECERNGLAHVADLAVAQLPVDFVALPRRLAALWKHERPDLWILTGECGPGGAIRVERVALNLLDAPIADNAGRSRRDAPVARGGPAAYFATLDPRVVRGALVRGGVQAELSLSAGSFCCNQAFYVARHLTRRTHARVIFLHIPRTGAGRGRAAPRLDDAARGLASLVRALARG
jgi:pyroglutamyl-peptidase